MEDTHPTGRGGCSTAACSTQHPLGYATSQSFHLTLIIRIDSVFGSISTSIPIKARTEVSKQVHSTLHSGQGTPHLHRIRISDRWSTTTTTQLAPTRTKTSMVDHGHYPTRTDSHRLAPAPAPAPALAPAPQAFEPFSNPKLPSSQALPHPHPPSPSLATLPDTLTHPKMRHNQKDSPCPVRRGTWNLSPVAVCRLPSAVCRTRLPSGTARWSLVAAHRSLLTAHRSLLTASSSIYPTSGSFCDRPVDQWTLNIYASSFQTVLRRLERHVTVLAN